MKVQIRVGQVQDSDAIAALNRELLGYDYPSEKTREQLVSVAENPHHKIFVAVLQDQVVGYVHACDYTVLYAPKAKEILGIAVAANHQRQGIGRLLLSAVEHWAADDGAASIRLAADASRKGAQVFCSGCGYENGKMQYVFRKML